MLIIKNQCMNKVYDNSKLVNTSYFVTVSMFKKPVNF